MSSKNSKKYRLTQNLRVGCGDSSIKETLDGVTYIVLHYRQPIFEPVPRLQDSEGRSTRLPEEVEGKGMKWGITVDFLRFIQNLPSFASSIPQRGDAMVDPRYRSASNEVNPIE